MPTLTKLYSIEEASQHNTKDDCWVVIDGKVYDVSSYMDEHPGGDDVILDVTGKDAADEFEDAGHSDSDSARDLLETFCIGELDTSPPIPQLEIVTEKKQTTKEITNKLKDLTTTLYWSVPVSVVGISAMVFFFYLRKK